MPTNAAAWLRAKHGQLEVGPAPYPRPREGEVVVRNHAVAVNPLDWILQDVALVFPWIKYPFVLGADLAGEVVEVGPGVTRFAVGDRVLGHAVGTDRTRNSSAEGAFQHYTVILAHLAAPIPDTLSYEEAAVLPLALSTAACALFQRDQLALDHPRPSPQPTGLTLLVWGGSTSVGSNAIQLAVAAGYEVVTTAAPSNHDYVQRLGASYAVDRHGPRAVPDVIEALSGKTLAGALAVGTGSAEACSRVVHASTGTKFVATASTSVSFAGLRRRRGPSAQLPLLLLRLTASTAATRVRMHHRGIGTKAVFGSSLMGDEVGTLVYEDFLPRALAEGQYLTAPAPLVVGHGLEHVQAGLDLNKRGVSARKVVISL